MLKTLSSLLIALLVVSCGNPAYAQENGQEKNRCTAIEGNPEWVTPFEAVFEKEKEAGLQSAKTLKIQGEDARSIATFLYEHPRMSWEDDISVYIANVVKAEIRTYPIVDTARAFFIDENQCVLFTASSTISGIQGLYIEYMQEKERGTI